MQLCPIPKRSLRLCCLLHPSFPACVHRLERELEQSQGRSRDLQQSLTESEESLQKTSVSLHSLEQVKIEMDKELSKCRREVQLWAVGK